jgi:hypothetical protein
MNFFTVTIRPIQGQNGFKKFKTKISLVLLSSGFELFLVGSLIFPPSGNRSFATFLYTKGMHLDMLEKLKNVEVLLRLLILGLEVWEYSFKYSGSIYQYFHTAVLPYCRTSILPLKLV